MLLSFKRFFLRNIFSINHVFIDKTDANHFTQLFAAYVGYLPLFLFALICYVFYPDARTLLF